MAFTEVNITGVTHRLNADATREYVVTYLAISDNANDGPILARLSTPNRFTSFSFGGDFDAGAVLKSKEVKFLREKDSYRHWVINCNYDSKVDPDENDNEFDDPLLKATKWSGSFVQFIRDLVTDKDGIQIKNSAGDPFVNPPVTADDSRMSIVAVKNFAALNVNVWASFRDAVNDDTWWGLGARKIKVQSITWDQMFFEGQPFYAVRYEFHINDDTWDEDVLQAGFYERVGGKRTRISERLGRDINSPWPLSTGGVALTEAQIDADGEEYLTVRKYNERDFALLGLPAVLGAA